MGLVYPGFCHDRQRDVRHSKCFMWMSHGHGTAFTDATPAHTSTSLTKETAGLSRPETLASAQGAAQRVCGQLCLWHVWIQTLHAKHECSSSNELVALHAGGLLCLMRTGPNLRPSTARSRQTLPSTVPAGTSSTGVAPQRSVWCLAPAFEHRAYAGGLQCLTRTGHRMGRSAA